MAATAMHANLYRSEYEYVMQLARAYDRGLINFEKWTEYSSGLVDFLEEHPKPATKFQLVRNFHGRFVQAQRGAHMEQEPAAVPASGPPQQADFAVDA